MTGYVLPPSRRFYKGREHDLPLFLKVPERPLRSVPANTPSTRTGEILSLVLDGESRRAQPLRHIAVDRRWLTSWRAALAGIAIATYVGGMFHGYTIARRAAVVEAEVRAGR